MRAGEAAVRGEWEIPEGVTIAASVDLTRHDPAQVDGQKKRHCIGERRAGGRCTAPARSDGLLCNAHSRHLDSTAGGHARAAKIKARSEEAAERMVVAEMGARAVIRQAVLKDHAKLTATVQGLLADAEKGDRRAQQLLLGYLTQGFGSPNVPAGETAPPDASDLSSLSTAELRALAMRPAAQPSD